jgi:hypothetical protein
MAAMVRQLEAAAVAADRAAGATWAQIGAPLGLSADGARRRYRPGDAAAGQGQHLGQSAGAD